MSRRLLGVTVACALAHAGCLHSSHSIPHRELSRLASLPPEQRGQSVRVVQDITGNEPPATTGVSSDTTVIVVVDGGGGGGGRGGRPPPGTRPTPHGSGGAGGKGASNGLAGAKADDARALFIIAAIVGITLAFTEGARYDGWVGLHPMHPVHLYGPGGYVVMPLAHIDPDTAAWSERAVVRPSEGPWNRLGRAPLDRAGWSYSVLIGPGTSISGDGSDGVGTAGHVQLGYFPQHSLGFQVDWGFSMRDNVVDETLFDNRLGLDVTFAPVDVGILHGGIFGNVALASRFEDGVVGGRADGIAVSGGALLQLEITTRLALTGRFAMASAYGDVTKDATFGLSIY